MFLPLIEKRRSIRRYLPYSVEKEKIAVLIEAALRAPSSRGFNPWEFIFVTQRDLLKTLSLTKEHGSSFLRHATLGIVVCADAAKSDVWVEDASIASIFIQLAAESIGLGSCWIQIRERMHDQEKTAQEYISEILNIPAELKVESIIAVGHPEKRKAPHAKEDLQYDKIYLNSYGKLYRGS
ncbi:MAG: nitroreductase family protein [Thermodesulfobacteriota bacterium]|nr:nitroreductase family protein [Thermodesulfobacteriota bacterium]